MDTNNNSTGNAIKKSAEVNIHLEQDSMEKAEKYNETKGHKCNDNCKIRFPLHWAVADLKFNNFKQICISNKVDLKETDCQGNTVLLKLCQQDKFDDKDDNEDDDDIVDDDDIEDDEDIENDDDIFTKKNEELVKMFLNRVGEDRDFINQKCCTEKGSTALHYAAKRCNVTIVKLLLNCGADSSMQNNDGDTPVHRLREWRSESAYECTEILLDAMNDKNVLNDAHLSPLEEAILVVHIASARTIQMMIDKGCSVSAVNKHYEPISVLRASYAYTPDEENIKALGVFMKHLTAEQINAVDGLGQTALHIAAYYLDVEMMKSLLSNEKINIFAKDEEKYTALHCIASRGWNKGSTECVELLMKKADTDTRKKRLFNAKNEDKKTALDLSIEDDSVPLSKVILLSHPRPYGPMHWMDKNTFDEIYNKVPEIFLPVLDNSINYEKKNYEANEETFSANIHELFGMDYVASREENDILKRETKCLAVLLESPYVQKDEMKNFISHPIVSLFILEKWKKLRGLYWCGMFCKMAWLLAYITFTIYVFWFTFPFEKQKNDIEPPRKAVKKYFKQTTIYSRNESILQEPETKQNQDLNSGQYAYGLIIVISNLILLAMKFVLLISTVSWKKTMSVKFFFHSLFDICVCGIVISVCVQGIHDWHHVAFAISIIWIGFTWMWDLRDFPVIGTYAEVFFIVLKNLLKLMISFLPLLIGFSIAIGMMLRQSDSFEKIHWNPIKILVMMIGEINFDDIINDEFGTPSRTSTILIVAVFVITVPIVMFNLLLGFTISDVQALKSEGDFKVLISNLDLSIILERLVLSTISQKIFSEEFLRRRFLMEAKGDIDGWEYYFDIKMKDIRSEIRENIRKIARDHQLGKKSK